MILLFSLLIMVHGCLKAFSLSYVAKLNLKSGVMALLEVYAFLCTLAIWIWHTFLLIVNFMSQSRGESDCMYMYVPTQCLCIEVKYTQWRPDLKQSHIWLQQMNLRENSK